MKLDFLSLGGGAILAAMYLVELAPQRRAVSRGGGPGDQGG